MLGRHYEPFLGTISLCVVVGFSGDLWLTNCWYRPCCFFGSSIECYGKV